MFDNNFGAAPYGVPQGTGFQFNGMQPGQVPTFHNNLTQEQIQKLMQKENQFSLTITETEKLRAGCNHRWNDGRNIDAIVEDPANGTCRCQICGYEFNPLDTDTTPETLLDTVKDMLDILQTTKMLYLDMPSEIAMEFYTIIPLIEKVPDLFKMAVKNYNKYYQYTSFGYNNRNMNTMQMFNMLSNALNGGFNPQGNFGQQMPGQMPYGAQQFNPQGFPGAAPAAFSNGFVMQGQPQQPGYMPNTMGFQYNPNQPQVQPAAAPAATPAPAQPATPPADANNVVEVNTTFK